MTFIWRSKSWLNNLWTSAIAAIVTAQIIYLIIEIFISEEVSQKFIDDYMYVYFAMAYIFFLILRMPKGDNKTN